MHDLRFSGVVEPDEASGVLDLVPVALPLHAVEGLAGHGLVAPVIRAPRAARVRESGIVEERSVEFGRRVQVDEVRRLRGLQRASVTVDDLRRVRREVRRDRHDVAPACRRRDRCAEERHVVRPIPVGARVPVHPRHEPVRRSRYVVVADDVSAVQRDRVFRGEVPGEGRGGLVHRLRVPGRALDREALVLVADRVHVDVPVAGVPRDVLVVDHLRDLAVRRAQHVVRAHVREWILEDLDRSLVVGLGVVDDDEANVEAVGFASREVEVPVVARILRVILVIRGRNEPALDVLRAVEGRVFAIEERERAGGLRVRRDTARRERHRVSGAGSAGCSAVHECEDVVGEAERDTRLVRAAELCHRAVPLRRIRRRAAHRVASEARQQRRACPDVLSRARLQLLRRDPDGRRGGRETARAGVARTGGRIFLGTLAREDRRGRRIGKLHGAEPARGTRPDRRFPPADGVRHRHQYVLRYAKLSRRRFERGLK